MQKKKKEYDRLIGNKVCYHTISDRSSKGHRGGHNKIQLRKIEDQPQTSGKPSMRELMKTYSKYKMTLAKTASIQWGSHR